MKLAIAGSRDFNNFILMERKINELDIDIKLIISGGAKGADTLAYEYAKKYAIPLLTIFPNWSILGKKAGYVRNGKIVESCDKVIAFWDGESKGTKHTIDIANRKGKVCKVIRYR